MKWIFVQLLALATILSGCGDLNDGKAVNPNRVIEELKGTNCEVNTDNLEKILSEPIPEDINCIYDQLSVLMKLVRTERPELDGGKNITRQTLENFIEKYVPNAAEALEYFDIFFTLNGFIFGSDDDILIEEDFRRLRDFLIMVNREISAIYPHLEKLDEDDRIGIRFHLNIKEQKILKTFNYIVRDARTNSGENISLLGLLDIRPTTQRKLDVPNLIQLFENDDNSKTIEEIKNFVFLKRVLMGGSKIFLEHSELISFLRNNLEEFVDSFYDLYRHKHLSFDNESKRFELYNENLNRIRRLIYSADGENSLVDFFDIFKVLNFYRSDILGEYSKLDFQTIGKELIRIKQIFLSEPIGANKAYFNHSDFMSLLDLGADVVDQSIANSKLFNDNRDYLLSNKGKITDGSQLVTDLPANDPKYTSFLKVLMKNRYFKGDNILPSFGNDIDRNIQAVNLISALNYVSDIIFRFYEKQYPCNSTEEFDVYNYKKTQIHKDHRCDGKEDYSSSLNAGQLIFVVQEFRSVLYETKIVSQTREDKAGENAANIPDLFLESANDDGFLQYFEFVDFLLILFDSIDIRKEVMPYIADRCPVVDDTPEFSGARYDTICVRDRFYETFTETFEKDGKQFRYFDFFPKFEEKYNNWVADGRDKFLRKYILLLEGFTKVCSPYDNYPYSQADVMGLYTSVFTVESTLNKFDTNGDNVIDKKEAKKAYKHFKRGLRSILKDQGGKIFGGILASFSKQFFKFLTDKKRLPFKVSGFFKNVQDVIDLLVTYTLKPFNEINREKIITVLSTLQDTGEPKRKKRLGDLYESTPDYCDRTNPDINEFVNREWGCYVEGREELCP